VNSVAAVEERSPSAAAWWLLLTPKHRARLCLWWGIPRQTHSLLSLCRPFHVTLSCGLFSFLVGGKTVEGFIKSP